MNNDDAWIILPAAGIGRRMQADRPKQYLPLKNRYLIDHTLDVILNYPRFKKVVLVLADDDDYWQHSTHVNHPDIICAPGGEERCYSVMNGLLALDNMAQKNDWVAVHDVARPCLQQQDLDALFLTIQKTTACGAILATPTRDTMKRGRVISDQVEIDTTVERQQLWHALTPQIFRYDQLKQALKYSLTKGLEVTDEASALENTGEHPLLVEGSSRNIKVTHPGDLALVQLFLNDFS